MNRTFPGRAFFVAIYVILAIGFLIIHFTRVEKFATVAGGMTVKGRSSVGTALMEPQIRRLAIIVDDFELSFRQQNKAILITDDGIKHYLDITSWEMKDDAVIVNFSEGVILRILPNTSEANISIVPYIPFTKPPVRSFEFPFKPRRKITISSMKNPPETLGVISDTGSITSLPDNIIWYSKQNRLDMIVLNNAKPYLIINNADKRESRNALN